MTCSGDSSLTAARKRAPAEDCVLMATPDGCGILARPYATHVLDGRAVMRKAEPVCPPVACMKVVTVGVGDLGISPRHGSRAHSCVEDAPGAATDAASASFPSSAWTRRSSCNGSQTGWIRSIAGTQYAGLPSGVRYAIA